jgi:hypothetical protein
MLYYDKNQNSFIEIASDEIYDDECIDMLDWDMVFDEAYDTCAQKNAKVFKETCCEDASIPMTPIEFFLATYTDGSFFESRAITDGYTACDTFFCLTA